MKRLSLLFFLCVLLCHQAVSYAEEVDLGRATQVAESFFGSGKTTKGASSDIVLKWTGNMVQTKAGSTPAFYVFENIAGGFVVVSGDDCVQPVLGYSYEGKFSYENMPPNVEAWFSGLEDGIRYMRESGAVSDALISEKWNELSSGSYEMKNEMSPVLLETAEWNQTEPFNRLTSVYGSQYTGCGATAMSIILRYFRYPERGHGQVGGYSYETAGGQTVYVDSYQLGETYDWDNMPLSYQTYTEEQAEAVSQLMFECALSLEAMFDTDGTGTYDNMYAPALIDHMSYDAGIVSYDREIFSQSRWLEMLYSNIRDTGPVWYSGQGDGGGHTFVVDGYDSEGNLHINWGWGGYDNGYYAFPDFGDYPYSHTAVFGIKPDEGGEAPEIVGLKEAYDNMGLTFTDPDIEVEVNVPFEVKYGFVYNAGTTTFNGSIAVVSVDRMEQIKEFLAVDLQNITLEPGYGYYGVVSRCTITEDIEIGDKIKLYYRSNRGGDWMPVLFGTDFGVTGELYLTDPYFIREVTSFEYLPEENLIRIETLADLDWTFSSSYGGEVAGGNTFDDGIIEIDTTDLPSGEYTVRISSDKDSFALDVVL